MKYLFVEERVVVTQHTVSEVTAESREVAFNMFDAFCASHSVHPDTRKMIVYEVDVNGNKTNIGGHG